MKWLFLVVSTDLTWFYSPTRAVAALSPLPPSLRIRKPPTASHPQLRHLPKKQKKRPQLTQKKKWYDAFGSEMESDEDELRRGAGGGETKRSTVPGEGTAAARHNASSAAFAATAAAAAAAAATAAGKGAGKPKKRSGRPPFMKRRSPSEGAAAAAAAAAAVADTAAAGHGVGAGAGGQQRRSPPVTGEPQHTRRRTMSSASSAAAAAAATPLGSTAGHVRRSSHGSFGSGSFAGGSYASAMVSTPLELHHALGPRAKPGLEVSFSAGVTLNLVRRSALGETGLLLGGGCAPLQRCRVSAAGVRAVGVREPSDGWGSPPPQHRCLASVKSLTAGSPSPSRASGGRAADGVDGFSQPGFGDDGGGVTQPPWLVCRAAPPVAAVASEGSGGRSRGGSDRNGQFLDLKVAGRAGGAGGTGSCASLVMRVGEMEAWALGGAATRWLERLGPKVGRRGFGGGALLL